MHPLFTHNSRVARWYSRVELPLWVMSGERDTWTIVYVVAPKHTTKTLPKLLARHFNNMFCLWCLTDPEMYPIWCQAPPIGRHTHSISEWRILSHHNKNVNDARQPNRKLKLKETHVHAFPKNPSPTTQKSLLKYTSLSSWGPQMK